MNIERFYGEERSADELMGACQSMPAFAEGRLLVWRGHSKAQGTKLLGKLIPHLENPNPSTLLVLVLAGAPMREGHQAGGESGLSDRVQAAQ